MESWHSEGRLGWRLSSGSDLLVLIDSGHFPLPFWSVDMASPKPKTKAQSPLLATTTNEPFQPVRIYFAVPDADALMAKLQTLACMNVDPTRNCLEWLFDHESASLRFPGTFEDVPPAMRPIVLGRLRFPRKTAMTLQANSISRYEGGLGAIFGMAGSFFRLCGSSSSRVPWPSG